MVITISSESVRERRFTLLPRPGITTSRSKGPDQRPLHHSYYWFLAGRLILHILIFFKVVWRSLHTALARSKAATPGKRLSACFWPVRPRFGRTSKLTFKINFFITFSLSNNYPINHGSKRILIMEKSFNHFCETVSFN